MRFPNLYDTPKCFKTVLESLELSSGEPSNAFLPHEAESCRELLLLLTLGFCFSFFFCFSFSRWEKRKISTFGRVKEGQLYSWGKRTKKSSSPLTLILPVPRRKTQCATDRLRVPRPSAFRFFHTKQKKSVQLKKSTRHNAQPVAYGTDTLPPMFFFLTKKRTQITKKNKAALLGKERRRVFSVFSVLSE